MTPPDPKKDDLGQLYHQANAQDPRRPAQRVDAAILAHARMVAAAGQGVLPDVGSDKPAATPANHPHGWRAMLASVALIGLIGLLFLQFDRGTPQEKDLVQGTQQPAESRAGRLASAPQPERSGGPPTADVAAADTRVTDAAPTTAPAQVEQSSGSSMTGEGQLVPVESVAPRAPLNRAATALPEAPMAMAREREDSPQAGAAPADTQQKTRLKSIGPSPSVRREAAAPSASPPIGDTALHALARTGQVATLDAVLATGAAIDARDARGRTPLMEAAARGHADMVGRLLAGGANRQLRDGEGQTAAQLARAAGHLPLAELIETGS